MKRTVIQRGRQLFSAVISASMLLTGVMVGTISAQEQTPKDGADGLMVGVGMEVITPTSDMYPTTWGSGNRGFTFIGAVEDIYVRVIAVSNAGENASPENTSLILSFETGKGPYPAEFIETLSSETGVPKAQVFGPQHICIQLRRLQRLIGRTGWISRYGRMTRQIRWQILQRKIRQNGAQW